MAEKSEKLPMEVWRDPPLSRTEKGQGADERAVAKRSHFIFTPHRLSSTLAFGTMSENSRAGNPMKISRLISTWGGLQEKLRWAVEATSLPERLAAGGVFPSAPVQET